MNHNLIIDNLRMTIMNIKYRTVSLIIVLISIALSGCAGFQPLSNYARTGDTVALAIGGTHDSNAQVPILKKENITVEITDSLNNTYPVELRYLFRTYADYTSTYGYHLYRNTSDFVEYSNVMSGQWVGIIDLVDPVTGSSIPLSEGIATIHVTSSDLVSFVPPSNPGLTNPEWTNGNLQDISIEILPGTGSSNSLNYLTSISYDPMKKLEPLSQIEVSPVVGTSGYYPGLIGGAEFVFVVNQQADFGGIKVVPVLHDPAVQLSYKQVNNSDGTRFLKVIIMNPVGFKPTNNRDVYPGDYNILTKGGSIFRSLGFSLVWKNGTVTDSNWTDSIQLDSARYINIDGDDIPESYITYSINKVN